MYSVVALHEATHTPLELYGVLPLQPFTVEQTPLAPPTSAVEMNWFELQAAAQTRFDVRVGAATSYGVEPSQTVRDVQTPLALKRF